MPSNEAVPKLKLSEAMRLGAMLKPQGFSGFRHNGRTCALGAVADSIGGVSLDGVVSYYSHLTVQPATCPACVSSAYSPKSLVGAIIHLNDTHRWTRERIADWIEAEFEKEPETATPVAIDTPASELVGV